ncbi:MAG: hypothetical protein HY331_08570 [Chloroflexi bacterium]|nr:hypothetical protein [Chloroflexota bacterium]
MTPRRVSRDRRRRQTVGAPLIGKLLLVVLAVVAVMVGIALGSTLQTDSSFSAPATLQPTPTAALAAVGRTPVPPTPTTAPRQPTRPAGTTVRAAVTPSPTAVRPPTVTPTPTLVIAPEKPSPLFLAVLSVTSPITRGQPATLTIQTMPRAQIRLAVRYGGAAASPSDLGERTADPSGRLTWSWIVDAGAPVGPAQATLVAALRGVTVTTEAAFVAR